MLQYLVFNTIIDCLSVLVTGSKELRVLGMLPMTGNVYPVGNQCRASKKMALEDVNAFPGLLDGYNLTYDYIDSMCTRGIAAYRTFNALNEYRSYVMLLGDECSTSTESTAEVSHYYNITQISYGASSPVLSDRKRFKKFFRLAAPAHTMIPAYVQLFHTFNWRRLAIMHEVHEHHMVLADELVAALKEADVEVISKEVFNREPMSRIKYLKDQDARIIFVYAYEDRARSFLCDAYTIGLYGPKIILMFPGWLSENFWQANNAEVNCTVEQMDMAIEGAFLTTPIKQNPIEERGIANLTNQEFNARFLRHPDYNASNQAFDIVAPMCYDTIWMCALALNCTIATLKEIGHSKTLDNFTYADGDIGEIIFNCTGRTSMMGVSGQISFHNGSDPNKMIRFERIQGSRRVQVAYFRQDLAPNSFFEWRTGAIIWKDNLIPRDSTHIVQEEKIVPLSLYIAMCSVAGLGMVTTVSLFIFNIVSRHNRSVKLSSPNINNVLLLGCFLCYITVFINITETNIASLCIVRARAFCFCLGFTLMFGSLFSKTWRVYRIFTNKKLRKMTITDYQLLVIIGIIVGVVLVVLVAWEIYTPHKMVIKYINKSYTNGNDEIVHQFIRICFSKNSSYFTWSLYIIEGALLSFGAFLAFETRNVKIEALNDSHQISLCLYNVVILSGVGLTLSLVLEDQVVYLFCVTSGCIILGTFVTELIIFIPKLHAVYKEMEAKSVTTKPGPSSTSVIETLSTGIKNDANNDGHIFIVK